MGVVEKLEDLPILLRFYSERTESESPLAFWAKPTPDFLYPLKDRRAGSWPKLEELIHEMRCGATEYVERRSFSTEGIPFTSAKTVTWLGVDFSRDQKFIQPGSIMDKEKAHTRVGDVLFVRVGVGCSGRAAVVTDSAEEGVADDWIYIIRPKKLAPFYLALFFATEFGRSQVDRLKRGVGTVTIPQKLLKAIRIPLPPEELNKEVEEGYLSMVRLRREGKIAEAEERFQSLVGRIEVWLSLGSL
jgi:type I restriction enzyme M protein